MHALQYFTLCFMYVVSMLNRSRAELRKTSQTPEPGHKNPRVQALSVKWRQVWLMTMDRRRRLQDALDLQKEVCVCLSIEMYIHELCVYYFIILDMHQPVHRLHRTCICYSGCYFGNHDFCVPRIEFDMDTFLCYPLHYFSYLL